MPHPPHLSMLGLPPVPAHPGGLPGCGAASARSWFYRAWYLLGAGSTCDLAISKIRYRTVPEGFLDRVVLTSQLTLSRVVYGRPWWAWRRRVGRPPRDSSEDLPQCF
jgi:hypothetical protein